MNSSKQILIIEIKTIDSGSFDTQQLEKMIIYQDHRNKYFLSTGVERIKTAILDAIPRLGSNYRHPLLFGVQIFPGDAIDAQLASIEDLRGRVQGVRKRNRGSN